MHSRHRAGANTTLFGLIPNLTDIIADFKNKPSRLIYGFNNDGQMYKVDHERYNDDELHVEFRHPRIAYDVNYTCNPELVAETNGTVMLPPRKLHVHFDFISEMRYMRQYPTGPWWHDFTVDDAIRNLPLKRLLHFEVHSQTSFEWPINGLPDAVRASDTMESVRTYLCVDADTSTIDQQSRREGVIVASVWPPNLSALETVYFVGYNDRENAVYTALQSLGQTGLTALGLAWLIPRRHLRAHELELQTYEHRYERVLGYQHRLVMGCLHLRHLSLAIHRRVNYGSQIHQVADPQFRSVLTDVIDIVANTVRALQQRFWRHRTPPALGLYFDIDATAGGEAAAAVWKAFDGIFLHLRQVWIRVTHALPYDHQRTYGGRNIVDVVYNNTAMPPHVTERSDDGRTVEPITLAELRAQFPPETDE